MFRCQHADSSRRLLLHLARKYSCRRELRTDFRRTGTVRVRNRARHARQSALHSVCLASHVLTRSAKANFTITLTEFERRRHRSDSSIRGCTTCRRLHPRLVRDSYSGNQCLGHRCVVAGGRNLLALASYRWREPEQHVAANDPLQCETGGIGSN